MSVIQTGRYIITNVKQTNVAALKDPNDGTPVTAQSDDATDAIKWNVTRLSSGKYSIQNVGAANYANAGNRPPVGTTVEGRASVVQWEITETRVKNQFTIASTDSHLYWGLEDDQIGTSVQLSKTATDQRNWWTFTSTEVNEPVIGTGRYTITNVKQKNVAALKDPNDGTPVTAQTNDSTDAIKWNVTRLSSGKYNIQSVGAANYANAGNRPPVGTTVEGRASAVQWEITETRVKNQFTIATTDSRLYWGLEDDQTGTSVQLSETATDQRNWWTFAPTQ